MPTDVPSWATGLATLIVALGATTEAWRARRAANRGRAETETVVAAVTPSGDVDGLSNRLERIEQFQHQNRRVLDRVERTLDTHLQLHQFVGAMQPRSPMALDPPARRRPRRASPEDPDDFDDADHHHGDRDPAG